MYFSQGQSSAPSVLGESSSQPTKSHQTSSKKIAVEISGAVIHPNVYTVSEGARMNDILKLAGGLSPEADSFYVARNFNMAKYVGDQEKIYIPYSWDIYNGTFSEEKRILEYLTPMGSSDIAPIADGESIESLSINSATLDELDSLPGIGPTTAQKIIDSRPYTTIEELLSKKILKSNVYEQIKNTIKI
jgi:competence protein ComEA